MSGEETEAGDSPRASGATWRRTLNPGDGRYTQADPLGLVAGWNLYVHVENNSLMFTDPSGLLGQGSGGNARGGKRPAAGTNVTVGAGGSFHTPLGVGLGADAGVGFDTKGNMCFYSNICYTVGPGMALGGGIAGAVGSGLLSSGTTKYEGACWGGGAGLGGTGAVLFGNDGSAQLGRSVIGPSIGGQATYQVCTQQLICARN